MEQPSHKFDVGPFQFRNWQEQLILSSHLPLFISRHIFSLDFPANIVEEFFYSCFIPCTYTLYLSTLIILVEE